MSRPALVLEWASNPNYVGGPDAGNPTKVEPSAGRKADGWRNGDQPPAQEQNWWQEQVEQWVKWLDAPSVALADLEDQPVGTGRVVFTADAGYYTWFAGAPLTADGYWVVTSTDTGQWIHQSVNASGAGRVALVGPAPGDAWTPATTAGRINQSVVPYGRFGHVINNAQQFNSTSTSLTTFGTLANFGSLQFVTGDIISLEGSCIVSSDEDIEIGPAISTDGGTTWVGLFDTGGGDVHPAYTKPVSASRNISVGFAFTRILAGSTTGLRVALRGKLLGAGSAAITTSAFNVWSRRP